MYLRLAGAGHDVRVYASDPESQDVLAGMLAFTPRLASRAPVDPRGRDEGIVLFETVGDGAVQDRLRHEGYRVVGNSGSATSWKLIGLHGQRVLRESRRAGAALRGDARVRTLSTTRSTSYGRNRRYVYKMNGSGFAPRGTTWGRWMTGST
jgi:hypothetical protein